jgi:hypothetical protein
MMPMLVVMVMEHRMVLTAMTALVVSDRHDLATPRAERKLRQQHHARHDLDR